MQDKAVSYIYIYIQFLRSQKSCRETAIKMNQND